MKLFINNNAVDVKWKARIDHDTSIGEVICSQEELTFLNNNIGNNIENDDCTIVLDDLSISSENGGKFNLDLTLTRIKKRN
jgi:hypothetical protein